MKILPRVLCLFSITSDGIFNLHQATIACLGGLGLHQVWRFYDAKVWQISLLSGSFMKIIVLFD